MLTSCDFVEDVKETSEKESRAVDHLRGLVENLDISTNDDYLGRFLYGTNFNVDDAFKKIKNTHDHLLQYNDWYRKDGPVALKDIIEKDVRVLLPDCDKEGRPIYLMKNGNIDVGTMDMLDVVALDDVWIESILSNYPQSAAKGLCVIMDIKDQNWKLTKWMKPEYMRQSLKKIENLPFKDYKVHVVNNSWWITIAIKLLWPFLPQKFKDMLIFHFDDMDTFYEYIDKKVLPIEYGGLKEVKYSELYDKLYKRNDEIFKSFESYRK